MDPTLSRIAFTIAMTFLILAIYSLILIDPDSPEFIIDVISIIILTVFIFVVLWETKRELSSYEKELESLEKESQKS